MNRKGFTLVELLAVILILSGISMVAVVSITASLDRRGTKECEEQKELAINAAKIYFSANDGVTSVSISTLKTKRYFNQNSKITKLNDSSTVSITTDGYKFNGNCKS